MQTTKRDGDRPKETFGVPSKEEVDDFIRHIQALSISAVLKYLEKYGLNIINRLQSQSRMVSLYFVVRQLNFSMASFLLRCFLQFHANLEIKDISNNSLLFYVCNIERFRMFKYLLLLGVNINQSNIHGETVIHELVKNQSIEILTYLARSNYNINVNMEDKMKKTPLFYAVDRQSYELCQLLLQMGAKVRVKDYKNHTPVFYARKKLRQDINNLIDNARRQEIRMQNRCLKLKQQSSEVQMVEFQKEDTHEDRINAKQKTKGKKRGSYYNKFKTQQQSSQQLYSQSEVYLANDWRPKAKKTLNGIYANGCGQFFKEAVDETAYGISDYYSTIKKPMNLSIIGSKLKYNHYKSCGQFLQDINLIVDNCILYNGSGHFITQQAFKLKDLVDEIYL